MKKFSITLFVLVCMWLNASAQKNNVSKLFREETPMDVRLGYSFKDIKKSTIDTVYFPTTLSFKKDDGQWDSIPMGVRARGNFRRKNCSFAPIKIKIKKKDANHTVFNDNKSLKLVLPCQTSKGFNNLLFREYLCYRLYEVISPYHFKTRLLNVLLTDENGKKQKDYLVPGFFIEDNDLAASRFKGEVVDRKIHPLQFHDTLSVQHDMFQYLIGNTDWSVYGNHNECAVLLGGTKFVALPYDFDMAGIVNASYAAVNEELSIRTVKERLFRGYCRDESLFEAVRQDYIALEPKIYAVLSDNEKIFEPREFTVITKYIDDFFSIIKNDRQFKTSIVSACRNN